jgi:hypothetical protein
MIQPSYINTHLETQWKEEDQGTGKHQQIHDIPCRFEMLLQLTTHSMTVMNLRRATLAAHVSKESHLMFT